MAAVYRFARGERLDRLVAVCLVVAAEVVLFTGNASPGLPRGLGAALAVVVPATVAVRRRWPLAAGLVAILGLNLIFLVGAHDYWPPFAIAWICALYAIAVWTGTRGFLLAIGMLVASNVLTLLGPDQTPSNVVTFTVVPGVAMLIARRAVRDRQLAAEWHAARAELLEREQQLRANEALAEERARIARELHDLVAHSVSVMVVQAGAERHALADGPASTRETLSSIEQAGRQALAEARRLLGMLRRNGDQGELEPQPSLDQLDLLVERVQRAGLPVTLAVEGEPVALPAGIDLCAYRIVQEGLTNALRHAGPAHARVQVRYVPESLTVEVHDDGRGVSQPNRDGAGHGLIGMRERVALYGGQLTAGPRDGGGFEIRARLPLA